MIDVTFEGLVFFFPAKKVKHYEKCTVNDQELVNNHFYLGCIHTKSGTMMQGATMVGACCLRYG